MIDRAMRPWSSLEKETQKIYPSKYDVPMNKQDIILNGGHSEELKKRFPGFTSENVLIGTDVDVESASVMTKLNINSLIDACRKFPQHIDQSANDLANELKNSFPNEYTMISFLIERNQLPKASEFVTSTRKKLAYLDKVFKAAQVFHDSFILSKPSKGMSELDKSIKTAQTYFDKKGPIQQSLVQAIAEIKKRGL